MYYDKKEWAKSWKEENGYAAGTEPPKKERKQISREERRCGICEKTKP